jgi:hypothetical protein
VPERRFDPVAWDTLFVIGGQVEDTLLLRPRLIAARDGYLYAYDYADARLKAFDGRGNLRWIFGRQGQGPGEFGNATSLQIDDQGDVWIVDSSTSRITQVSRDGELGRMVPFRNRLIMRVVPLGWTLLVIPSDQENFWLTIDEGGRTTDSGPFPLPAMQGAAPMVRAPYVALSSSQDLWAAIFPWASPFLVYRGETLRCTGALVEGGPFPSAPSGDNVVWAVGAAMSDTSIFVLARGETRDERRMIDEYSADDCRYLRTLRLPALSQAIAYDNGIFYFYREEPAPTILGMRAR